MKLSGHGFSLIALLAAAFAAHPVKGDTTDIQPVDPVLEEVLVSGYRQVSPLEVEASLTVLDESTIRKAAIANFEELVPLVANMNLSGEGSRARYFQIRGVGEREQYEGAPNPSVGYFIDDIDLSGIGGVGGLFDVAQVEVLKGPHSARYGASALAGVVYMRSADPVAENNANVQVNIGGDDLFSAAGAIGGALNDSMQGRLSFSGLSQDGFRRNSFAGRDDTNGRNERTVRAKLNWDFSDHWSALLSLLYLDFDNGYDAFSVRNDAIMQSDHPGEDAQRTRAGSLRVSGELNEGVNLVSITSAANTDIRFSFDGDWGNDSFWRGYGDYVYDYRYSNPRQRDSISQEFRLLSTPQGRLFSDSTEWVVGVFLQQLQEDNAIRSTGIYDDRGEENFCAPCLTDRQLQSEYKADTWALFASLDSGLTDQLNLGLGLRFERWSARYGDQWNDINYPGQPPGGNTCTQFDCNPADNLWGGHVSLSYRFRPELQSYFRVARGFKAGGFNPSLAALQGVAVLDPEFVSYTSESLWNYELGLKGGWFDGRLSADFSVFFMDRKDAQLSQSSQQVEFDPNSFVFVTYNGSAKVRGAEASFSWHASPQLELHGSLGLLHTRIGNDASTLLVSPNALGRELAHAPSWKLNLGASWESTAGWFARLDLNSSDSFYFDISHNQTSDPYTLVNFRLGKQWQNWEISAWGRNIFDEDYASRGFYFGNEPPLFANTLYTKFGDPAQFGLSINYQY